MVNCKSCGLQLLFLKARLRKEAKVVLEDEAYGSRGKGLCWRCFRRVLRP